MIIVPLSWPGRWWEDTGRWWPSAPCPRGPAACRGIIPSRTGTCFRSRCCKVDGGLMVRCLSSTHGCFPSIWAGIELHSKPKWRFWKRGIPRSSYLFPYQRMSVGRACVPAWLPPVPVLAAGGSSSGRTWAAVLCRSLGRRRSAPGCPGPPPGAGTAPSYPAWTKVLTLKKKQNIQNFLPNVFVVEDWSGKSKSF